MTFGHRPPRPSLAAARLPLSARSSSDGIELVTRGEAPPNLGTAPGSPAPEVLDDLEPGRCRLYVMRFFGGRTALCAFFLALVVALTVLGVAGVRVQRRDSQAGTARAEPTTPEPSPANTVADMLRVNANGQGDGTALLSAMIFNTVTCALIYLSFLCLSRTYPHLYHGRSCAEWHLHRTTLGETQSFMRRPTVADRDTEADRIIESAGLDGWMVVEFYSLNMRMLAQVGSLLVLVLLPIHYCFGDSDVDLLSQTGINSLHTHHDAYWVHSVLVWVVVILCGRSVCAAQLHFLEYRYAWLSELPLPRATTIVVENIPQQYRSDAALQRYFVKMFSADAVKSAYVVRQTAELRRRIKCLQAAQSRERAAFERWERSGCRPEHRPRVSDVAGDLDALDAGSTSPGKRMTKAEYEEDAMSRYSNLLAQAENSVREERARVNRSATVVDWSTSSATGFVTFSSRRYMTLACDRQYTADARQFAVWMAPDPADVIYSDLAKDPITQLGRNWIGNLCLVGVFVCWWPLTLFAAGLTNLESMQEFLPFLEHLCVQHPLLKSFLEGVLASFTLKMIMLIMPNILYQIILRFFLLKVGTWTQLRLQSWYYPFQVMFVVLATAIGKSWLITAASVLNNPVTLFLRLNSTLPEASHFYMCYVTLAWSGEFARLLRLIALLKYNFFRPVKGVDGALQRAQDEHPAFFGTGIRMTKAATMTTVTLVFCMCSPLICVLAWVFFFIGRRVYKYLLKKAEAKRPDSGGAYWVQSLEHVFFSLFLFILLMVAVLSARGPAWCFGAPGAVAAGSLAALLRYWLLFRSYEWRCLPFEKVVEIDGEMRGSRSSRHAPVAQDGSYVQPECVEGADEHTPTMNVQTELHATSSPTVPPLRMLMPICNTHETRETNAADPRQGRVV